MVPAYHPTVFDGEDARAVQSPRGGVRERRTFNLFRMGMSQDPLLASAGLDRLLHHADVLVITGDSYRARSRQTTLPTPTEAPMTEPAP